MGAELISIEGLGEGTQEKAALRKVKQIDKPPRRTP
jgi:hypothetical protein